MNNELASALLNYINWLANKAIPVWSVKGIDDNGASIEQFIADGSPDCQSNKRIRVQARQMFVFAAAQQQGWIDNGFDLVASMEAYCQKYAQVTDKYHYAHILNADNAIINPNNDLYDVAFFLLAYAWRYHVFNDLNALHKANKLLNSIDDSLKESSAGWLEGDYTSDYRRQNPHMHLFEAFLTLFKFTKDGKWLAKAGEIYSLFETIFFDHKNGVLLEYFDKHWQPAQGEKGQLVEPGHMMEWVWLLRQYQKYTQAPVEAYCSALYHNALTLGLDKSGGVLFDEVNVSGKIIKNTKRCWPMTEWLKASLSQSVHAVDDYDYQTDALNAVNQLCSRYLNSAHQGHYIDSLDGDNQTLTDNAPASTLYHLMMAGIEAKQYLKQSYTVG